jgi:SAM-dependent methyltransferase
LSKGPNTKDDPSEEDSERRLRRRRKGGSLRVPSDNVPRRSSRPDSGEFPPSDDPRLAASVAYAFGDERSGQRPATVPGIHDPGASDGSGGGDIESPHTEPSVHRPEDPGILADDPDGASEADDSDLLESDDDVAVDAATETRYEDGENERTEVVDPERAEELARRRGARQHGQPRTPVAGLTPDSSSTLDYPLLEDDEDEYEDAGRSGSRDRSSAGAEPRGRIGQDRADSVDIPIEEVLEGGSGRIVSDGSGPYAAVRDAFLATGGQEGDGSPADALAALGATGLARHRLGVSDGTPRSIGRAQTMALSDADIEELDDEEGTGGHTPSPSSADAGWSMPKMPAVDWSGELGRSDSRFSAAPEAIPIETSAGSVITSAPVAAPYATGDDGRDAAASPAAGRSGIVRPMTNRDPGDSGEIIDDELIEEIEEAQRAAPMTAADGSAVPPLPLDLDSTLDLDGDAEMESVEQVEEQPAAASAGPAPVPPPKPPPAPNARAAAAAAAAAAADPSQTRPRRRRGKPWFEDIFDEDYLRTLPFLTPQATQMEAQFVMEALAISAGSQVLDVGCGYGRHAMELAARGYHVVGLDSSLPLLLRGADEAQRRGLTINFVHGDMRDMAFDAQFDGAYCLFSTFGYFDDETNKKTAQNICRALKPGARCVFEVLNRDYIIAELPLRVWWEGDGCVVLEEVDFNYFSSRLISNRSVVFDDGRQLEQEISIRSFGLHELGKLLHAAGFRVVEVSGNMITKGRFFGAQSRDIVVIAERRVEKPGSPLDGGGRLPPG